SAPVVPLAGVPSWMLPAKVLFELLLTVSVAAVLLAFSTNGEPGFTASVFKPPAVAFTPANRRTAVDDALGPNVITLGGVELSAPALAGCRTPSLIVTPPVNVLFPDRIKMLALPALRIPCAPPPLFESLIVPLKFKCEFVVLFSGVTVKSAFSTIGLATIA